MLHRILLQSVTGSGCAGMIRKGTGPGPLPAIGLFCKVNIMYCQVDKGGKS